MKVLFDENFFVEMNSQEVCDLRVAVAHRLTHLESTECKNTVTYKRLDKLYMDLTTILQKLPF